jgi:hypothetical protein
LGRFLSRPGSPLFLSIFLLPTAAHLPQPSRPAASPSVANLAPLSPYPTRPPYRPGIRLTRPRVNPNLIGSPSSPCDHVRAAAAPCSASYPHPRPRAPVPGMDSFIPCAPCLLLCPTHRGDHMPNQIKMGKSSLLRIHTKTSVNLRFSYR